MLGVVSGMLMALDFFFQESKATSLLALSLFVIDPDISGMGGQDFIWPS